MSAISSSTFIRRVSRRELAESPAVWFATRSMFGVVGLTTVAMLASSPAASRPRIAVFLAILVGFCVIAVRGQPPAMEDRRNDLLLLSISVGAALAMFAFQPLPEIGIGISLFIGPLIAVRLQSRRAIYRHLSAATASLAIAATVGIVLGELNQPTIQAITVIMFGVWGLGVSCMFTLEAAEAQGDELEQLVRRDPLTGLGNRRMLTERLADELTRHARTGRSLSVVVLDLNGFKALSNIAGHAAVDELLQTVASALTGAVSPRDIVIRQDGDEFCLILPNAGPEAARVTASTAQAALATIEFRGRAITTGWGVASFPRDALDGEVLLHVADRRMNEHKRTTRG